jgi:CheY-like chemotaxis protein
VLAKRILLSNHPEILRPMEDSLVHRDGFSVLIANDGREAFEIIEEYDPALAILDLEMMELGGDQCCRRVKGDPILCKTPVILVARKECEEEVRRCREAGCNEIIFKPIDGWKLVAAACRLLGISERRARRVGLSLPAHIGKTQRHLRPGTILDLNTDGTFVETRKLFPIDTEVVVEFSIPGGEDIQVRGRVAWVNHPEWMKEVRLPVGMGLQFIEPGESVREALQGFLEGQAQPGAGGGSSGTRHE